MCSELYNVALFELFMGSKIPGTLSETHEHGHMGLLSGEIPADDRSPFQVFFLGEKKSFTWASEWLLYRYRARDDRFEPSAQCQKKKTPYTCLINS